VQLVVRLIVPVTVDVPDDVGAELVRTQATGDYDLVGVTLAPAESTRRRRPRSAAVCPP
jgi:hypothetical protein